MHNIMQEGGYIFFERRNGEDIGVFALSFVFALLFHAALFAVLPEKFPMANRAESSEMTLEILPPELKNRVPDFIEANPYGNELVPLKDAPESFKNQTAADELPDPNSKSKLPSVKGEGKQYKKIVAGTSGETDNLSPARVLEVLQRPLAEHTRETQSPPAAQAQGNRPAQPARQAQAPQAEAAKAAQTAATQATAAASQSPAQSKPAAQAARQSAQSKPAAQAARQSAQSTSAAQSESANIAKPDKIDAARADDTSDENAIVLPKFAKTDTDSARRQADKPALPSAAAAAVAPKPVPVPQPANAAATVQPAQELPVPKPRPRLSMKIPAGPLADNPNAASKAGVVAAESRFSEFGAYQQRMIEAISRQWNLLGSRYDLSSAIGSQVAIEFSLNTEGELVDCKIVFSTSTNTGTGLCEQAILSTAPYGVWTQEMVNTLGAQPQQVKIKFWYR